MLLKYCFFFHRGILCGIFATDSTRTVYQRKLQRWLQCGRTAAVNTMEFNQVEPHIDIAATSKKITEDMETSVCNPQVNTIDVHGGNGPTASDTKPRTSHNVSSDDAAADGVHQKRHVSPVRMSRSEVLPQARTYSMNFAECGSESFSETSNGWCEMNKLIKQKSEKPKSKSIALCQPVVTLGKYDLHFYISARLYVCLFAVGTQIS